MQAFSAKGMRNPVAGAVKSIPDYILSGENPWHKRHYRATADDGNDAVRDELLRMPILREILIWWIPVSVKRSCNAGRLVCQRELRPEELNAAI